MNRNSYLDILRAAAIIMVVVYHVLQMCPVAFPALMDIAWYGQYGVELFFVLSGWLIGGLYWNEKSRFGDVELRRFWLRRWLRTIPPYLVALGLSWLAVYIHGGKSFDLGYLIFIQNYYDQIPYFLVSWSLCIEEHFYLFLPVLLMFNLQGDKRTFALFSLLVLVAPICRWWLSLNGVSTMFGYEQTATHLRMEGLLIGFWLAHENVRSPQRWHQMKQGAPWLLLAAGCWLLAAGCWLLLAAGCCCCCCCCCFRGRAICLTCLDVPTGPHVPGVCTGCNARLSG
ncbi:MAG: acyltransferase family protein [Prosthecobacter sp.]